jgi:large subunit ribosomal protein L23
MSNLIVLRPRLSEKAYGQSQSGNVYVFEVPGDVNKQTVAEAVASQFSVGIKSVNILNTKGKKKRTYMNKRGKFVNGSRVDIKKAYVTLVAGESIPIFAAEEEAETKTDKTTATLAKASEKAEKKAEKSKEKSTARLVKRETK